MTELKFPFDEKTVRSLRAGDAVTISGRVYTGRDKFHKWVADGGELPVDFKDGALYHCGPVCCRAASEGTGGTVCCRAASEGTGGTVCCDAASEGTGGPVCCRAASEGTGGTVGWRVMSAGPTTSVRENPYEPAFIAQSGVRIIIGKGGMDAKTLAAMKKHGCVYVQAVGGAGALYAASVRRVAGVSLLEEFGAAEAVWHFDVEDFRGVVAMDAHGRSLFAETEKVSREQLEKII